jgi:large subunit GTPase 1
VLTLHRITFLKAVSDLHGQYYGNLRSHSLILYCFQAEKLNITFMNPKSGVGLLSVQDREKVKETQDKNKQLLGIPRR